MDLILYGQLYNDAMSGMDTLFEHMKESMKCFNKKKYPEFYENRMKKYDRMLGKLKLIDDMVFGNRIKDSGK